jgi:hypothetical protein
MVLVQGTAGVDDADLNANRERYARESLEKLPATRSMQPPDFMRRFFDWYYTRIYVHVRPERIYVWPSCDVTREPQLFDSHLEEVRSGHVEEPEAPLPDPDGTTPVWDSRLGELGTQYRTGVLAVLSPDGFPFAVRLPVRVDGQARRVRIEADPVGVPLAPGLACLTAHAHAPDFTWQRNFQVRGDLVEEDGAWALVPHRLVGGFEMPPSSPLARVRDNFSRAARFRRIAKRELERRAVRT